MYFDYIHSNIYLKLLSPNHPHFYICSTLCTFLFNNPSVDSTSWTSSHSILECCLVWSCTDSHGFCEFMSTLILSCAEETVWRAFISKSNAYNNFSGDLLFFRTLIRHRIFVKSWCHGRVITASQSGRFYCYCL